MRSHWAVLSLAVVAVACTRRPSAAPLPAPARDSVAYERGTPVAVARGEVVTKPVVSFRSRRDSLEWVSARRRAERARGMRVVVSQFDRRLWVISGLDTLRSAPIATAMGIDFDYAGRSWTFRTPRGVRTVQRKQTEPVWTPPDWHYAEVAREYGLRLAYLPESRPVVLRDGTKLLVRRGEAGIMRPGQSFVPLVLDEEIVFDNTIFIPPLGSRNRRVDGVLGHYALDLGDAYMLHGTPYKNTIGTAATHGCIRLDDDDIAWLYQSVPVGTRVYIY